MFELWMFYIILSVIAIVIEMMAPTFFCINFAFSGIVTALISIFWGDFLSTLTIFIVFSIISIIFIKPVLVKYFKKGANADFNEQYIGKIVKAIEPINQNSGAVTIYDERWDARVKDGVEQIEAGADVKIIGNDSLILFVEKV